VRNLPNLLTYRALGTLAPGRDARFVLVFRPADALMDKLIANFSVSAP
jgi:hypothetical protein